MRPKSGLPKRKALRAMPRFEFGFKDNPSVKKLSHTSNRSGGIRGNKGITAVSLFAGCGGLDLGVLGGFSHLGELYPQLPFTILGAYDNDRAAVETYRLNIGENVHLRDLTEVDMRDLPRADVLFGGFPCQDFSSCGHKKGFNGSRGRLYRVLIEYMTIHRPALVVGENVPLLAGLDNGRLLDTVVAELEAVGYRVKVWSLNCPDFGLPQSRRRLFIMCVREDIPFDPKSPTPTHVMKHRTIDQAIDDLMTITDESVPNQSQYFVATKATAGAGQGDHTSKRGQVGYAVRANAKARVHFHYELERRLTIRECARLQSFPDEFVFPFSASTNLMQIGNAVPPIIGHQVGGAVVEFFAKLNGLETNLRQAS